MKLDVWLEAIRHSELEIQLENLSTGLGVSAQGKGLDRMRGGWGLSLRSSGIYVGMSMGSRKARRSGVTGA